MSELRLCHAIGTRKENCRNSWTGILAESKQLEKPKFNFRFCAGKRGCLSIKCWAQMKKRIRFFCNFIENWTLFNILKNCSKCLPSFHKASRNSKHLTVHAPCSFPCETKWLSIASSSQLRRNAARMLWWHAALKWIYFRHNLAIKEVQIMLSCLPSRIESVACGIWMCFVKQILKMTNKKGKKIINFSCRKWTHINSTRAHF